jgi:hypothetical protein
MSNPNALEAPANPVKVTDTHGDATAAHARLSGQVAAERHTMTVAELRNVHQKMAPKGTAVLHGMSFSDDSHTQALHPTKTGSAHDGPTTAAGAKGGKPGANPGEGHADVAPKKTAALEPAGVNQSETTHPGIPAGHGSERTPAVAGVQGHGTERNPTVAGLQNQGNPFYSSQRTHVSAGNDNVAIKK